ncbi:uncharacterized protein RCO7_06135 [Rhynchosporium graminicola]|uniref:Uncharacterized protein n=1 Tax=Rhynchosporium graminicola TaxID=2792576 RepID=A0A1E1L1L4_9HELO|nr:uncharacterized protein RCO7_06135 [Rhynchosporium commune]
MEAVGRLFYAATRRTAGIEGMAGGIRSHRILEGDCAQSRPEADEAQEAHNESSGFSESECRVDVAKTVGGQMWKPEAEKDTGGIKVIWRWVTVLCSSIQSSAAAMQYNAMLCTFRAGRYTHPYRDVSRVG